MDKVIISDPARLEAAKQRIAAGGPGKLQVVTDFDKTMTKCFVDGKKIASVISILRDEKYLTPDYPAKAQALFTKYHPIELDQSVSLEEKSKAMREWWSSHYDLLIESGLNRNDLERVAMSEKLAIRPGALSFLELLQNRDIPLLILSAAGLGTEAIRVYLARHGKDYKNIYIASNNLVWDESGRATGVQEPIVHSFNKDYTVVKQFSFYHHFEPRKNVVLLGDSLGDAEMMNGFDPENIVKIGFLNENSCGGLAVFKENYDVIILDDGSMDFVVESFKKAFDAVIPGDGPMDFVNGLLREILMASA